MIVTDYAVTGGLAAAGWIVRADVIHASAGAMTERWPGMASSWIGGSASGVASWSPQFGAAERRTPVGHDAGLVLPQVVGVAVSAM